MGEKKIDELKMLNEEELKPVSGGGRGASNVTCPVCNCTGAVKQVDGRYRCNRCHTVFFQS